MKKTKKYYRDAIASSYSSACDVINEAIEKYGNKVKKGYREVNATSSMGDNGRVEGFYYDSYHNRLFVNVYWQGDKTDGNDDVLFESNGVYLDEYFDNSILALLHDSVAISSEQLYEAMKDFSAHYLSKKK